MNIKQGKIQVFFKIILDPGPGSYRSPSDFGHYDGDVYKNTGGIAYMSRSSQLKSLNNSIRSSRSKLWEIKIFNNFVANSICKNFNKKNI